MKITPIRMRFVLAPTLDNTSKAMRRSRPVRVIAAARNKAPPTSAQAVLLKPPNAMDKALLVPIAVSGFAKSGAKPSMSAINAVITTALTG